MSKKRAIQYFSLFTGVLFLSFQFVCYNHVQSLLEFSGSRKTKSPETLSFSEKMGTMLFGVQNPRPAITETPENYGMVFTEVKIPMLSDTISCWIINSDPKNAAVLLFHGFASSKSSLLEEAKHFHSINLNVIMIDFRGSGFSTGSKTSIGFWESEEVSLVFQWAKKKYTQNRIYLYGQSMGAAAILRAIATQEINPDGIIIESVFNTLESTIKNRFSAMGIPSFPALQSMMLWAKILYGIDGYHHNPNEYASYVSCPTMVMHGGLDTRAQAKEGLDVFKSIKSPMKKWVVFQQAGHERLILNNPQKWTNSVRQFMEQMSEPQ